MLWVYLRRRSPFREYLGTSTIGFGADVSILVGTRGGMIGEYVVRAPLTGHVCGPALAAIAVLMVGTSMCMGLPMG